MKDILLYIMALCYIAAGTTHFVYPRAYKSIVPPWVPQPMFVVYVSGALEIIFALMLLPAATTHLAASLIILLLIAVFPANVQMAINFRRRHNPWLWLAIARLPLQPLLIWWAWVFTHHA
jgi:uncharacterized membrane protein